MFILLTWWYGQGWLWALEQVKLQLQGIGKIFAVKVLIQTWFAPWKQITSQANFSNFFQAMIDNLVSRFIGGFVRTIMLFVALLWALVTLIFGTIFIVIWPLLPLSIVILPILAFAGS